jgi:hypothetical protein
MKNIKTYQKYFESVVNLTEPLSKAIYNLFEKFITKKISSDELIEELRYIEIEEMSMIENVTDESLWFKFSTDDSLATTINDLAKDLTDIKNASLRIEQIEYALLNKSLRVFFS